MAEQLHLAIEAIDTFYLAASHRAPVRRIAVGNLGAEAPSVDLECFVETASATPLLHPVKRRVDLPLVGGQVTWDRAAIRPNVRALTTLEERLDGFIVVEARIDGELVATERQPMTFLAANQWMFAPSHFDSLAAFVHPNSPLLRPVLQRARALLGERTGSDATEGYQRDAQRVRDVAEAVFDALSELNLHYSDPPAGFEGYGQKIRTVEHVLAEGAATCLDSAALYASLLSSVGLNTFIVVVTGHAFTAVSTVPNGQLGEGALESVVTNRNVAASWWRHDLLLPVETTKFTATRGGGFDDAVRSASKFFAEGSDSLRALVNIERCVAHGVAPLPSSEVVGVPTAPIATASSQSTGELSTPPASASVSHGIAPPWPPLPVSNAPSESPFQTPPALPVSLPVAVSQPGSDAQGGSPAERKERFEAPERVKAWMRSLLDLSYSNNLLRLGGAKGTNGIMRFDLPVAALSTLEDRVMAGKDLLVSSPSAIPSAIRQDPEDEVRYSELIASTGRLFVPSPADAERTLHQIRTEIREALPDLSPAEVEIGAEESLDRWANDLIRKQIGSLRRRARELENLTGSNNLFLCIGELEWGELVNGALTSIEGRAPLILVPVRITGKESTGFKIVLDETSEPVPNYCLIEKLRQTLGISLDVLETPVTDEHGIDVPHLLGEVRQALIDAHANNARVVERASLAVLDFASFRLWRDLRDHWQDFQKSPIVAHLTNSPGETFVQPDVEPPHDLMLPVPCDESQLSAIRWAVAGRTFVLEGPPGTGKSQTITNLLAASMAAGLKVLFVAEKQPALDVVRRRLDEVGLTNSYIDLFDRKAKPEAIRSQIRSALDLAPEDRTPEWSETTTSLEALDRRLHSYRDAVHDRNTAGVSAWSAYQDYLRLGDSPFIEVPDHFSEMGSAQLELVSRALIDLPRVVGAESISPCHPWGLVCISSLDELDRAQITTTISQLAQARAILASAQGPLAQAIEGVTSAVEFSQFASVLERFAGRVTPETTDPSIGTPEWIEGWQAFIDGAGRFAAEQQPLATVFHPQIYATDIGPLIAAGQAVISSGMLSRSKANRTFRALIEPYLVVPFEQLETASVVRMLGAVQHGNAQAVHLRAAVTGMRIPGVVDWDPLNASHIEALRQTVDEMRSDAECLATPAGRSLVAHRASGGEVPDNFANASKFAADAWAYLGSVLRITDSSFRRWRAGRTYLQAWSDSEPRWLADNRLIELQRWCEVNSTVEPLITAGLGGLADSILSGDRGLTDIDLQFRRGVNRTMLLERLESGRLNTMDGRAHDRAVEDYSSLHAKRRELMPNRIPADLVAGRPLAAGTRAGAWGELEQELNRRSRRLSLRSLFERYGREVSDLTPCFLMGPDSVARFLPPGSVEFDLVVFDEASQIEVPRAIGAMGRAKAAVIVGDTRQMPPSRFGGSRGSDDDESDEPLLVDLESILEECRESNVPAMTLRCHYRSKHEGLISFSNQHFYDDALTTFPSPGVGSVTPVQWRRVDGRFRRQNMSGDPDEWPVRTNRIEALAVVDEILARLSDPERQDESLGVVTFNAPQKDLVLALLENCGNPRVAELLERDDSSSLLVQNLENVQGDERDVILLSTGFAPAYSTTVDGAEKRGRLPMNFGPLNQRGGERRLNVAVTRARSEVLVISSFDPEEMSLTDSSALGLQLLQAYLKAARDGGATGGRTDRRLTADLHRSDIAQALRDRGLEVEEDLGLSDFRIDLAVRQPGSDGWDLALLLDGPGWAQRGTVFDRDVMPHAVLRDGLGWPKVERLWLPMWLYQRGETLDRIVAAVARADERFAGSP